MLYKIIVYSQKNHILKYKIYRMGNFLTTVPTKKKTYSVKYHDLINNYKDRLETFHRSINNRN